MFGRATTHAASARATSATRAVTPPTRESSSSSSSLDDRREFHELIRGADEARQRFSDATCEVSRLERCLEAVRVVLEASKRETTDA